MRWVTGLLLGAVTSAALGSSQVIQNTYEGSLRSFTTWPAHEAARSSSGPLQRKMEISDIPSTNSEADSVGDVISGVMSASGDTSGTIAILTGDDLHYETAEFSHKLYALTALDDELRPTGSVGLLLMHGGDDAFRSNDFVALTRDYGRISERNTVGNDGDGTVTFDHLMPAGRPYGEAAPPRSVLVDDAGEPIGESGGLVKWVGGTLLMILVIATGIGVRERKSHRI